MAAFIANTTGNWNSSTTWSGAGIPGSGDTGTINAGVTVTVPDGYTAVIGATGQATGYTALTITTSGKLVIGGGTSGELRLQGDIVTGSPGSVTGTVTANPGSTLRFVPAVSQQVKCSFGNQSELRFNGSASGRITVLTDPTALAAGGIAGYFVRSSTNGGLTAASYTDFIDLDSGLTTTGMTFTTISTGSQFSLLRNTFTRCGGLSLSITTTGINCSVTYNRWISSNGTIFDNGRKVNLKLSYSQTVGSETRLVDSNGFDLGLELNDGRGFTITNNVFVTQTSFGSVATITGTGTGGQKWVSCDSNLLIQTMTTGNVPILTPLGDVTNNYVCNLGTGIYLQTLAGLGVYGNATASGNVLETPFQSATENYAYINVISSTGGPYVGTFKNNIGLPVQASASVGWQMCQFNGYNTTSNTAVVEHNTFCTGLQICPVQYDETTTNAGMLTSYKSNLLWHTGAQTSHSYHFLDETHPTTGGIIDFCQAANADYNATFNFYRDAAGDGQACSYSGSGTVHAISNCSNSGGLIKVTTSSAHGLATNNTVYIEGVTGTTEANNTGTTKWTVTVIDANNFTLNSSTFTNAYVSGGRVCTTYPFAGNGYQSHFSTGFAGAHDVADADPQFIDTTRSLATWYTAPGGANQSTTGTYLGDLNAAAAYILGTPETTGISPGVLFTAMLNWVKGGFIVRNPALNNAGADGVTIGAMPFASDIVGTLSNTGIAISAP